MHINTPLDGGNIEVIKLEDPQDIQLSIRSDHNASFKQWFYFRFTAEVGYEYRLRIVNAGDCSYVEGWNGYYAVASYDRENWFRVDTQYSDGELIIEHMLEADCIWFAYFAPYPVERHQNLIGWAQTQPDSQLEVLGDTLDGQPIDLLTIGEPDEGKKRVWFIARQHPGETMAEWWMEGFLEALLDESNPVAYALLERAVFYVVPNMNPDGSRRGHLRTNAAGANLNREWASPSLENSPEVYHVLNKMQQTGLDFCLDVHGDEALPYNFIAAAEGIPGWNDRLESLTESYLQALQAASPDFQTEHGYAKDQPGQANLTICTAALAQQFDALAMTLEMPFKDNVNAPDEYAGWSPERSKYLAEANLTALLQVIDQL